MLQIYKYVHESQNARTNSFVEFKVLKTFTVEYATPRDHEKIDRLRKLLIPLIGLLDVINLCPVNPQKRRIRRI